ncbi:hypothetical protein [Tolypothrix bouteillei]|uniref:hypothetical protein n=1 Tax=Tolypothrix bouteillei TaxID=1246981 RepID=UPI001F2D3F54|nr:hypothetical protein [Tolypothrix bouteillei]
MNSQEEQRFQEEIGTLKEQDKEGIMEIVTSWERRATLQATQSLGFCPQVVMLNKSRFFHKNLYMNKN